MYIRFDYRCTECGHEEQRLLKKGPLIDMQIHFCTPDECFYMERQLAAPRTLFRFNDQKLKP